MATLKTIKTKMGAVSNVRKITKTMEAVAASKMKKSIARALSTREYAGLALELLRNLSQDKYVQDPLLNYPEKATTTLIVPISSNKGLCGGYNMSIARAVWKYLRADRHNEDVAFVTVGKYSEKMVKKLSKPLVGSFLDFSDTDHSDEVRPLSNFILNAFSQGAYSRVLLVYANFVSGVEYKPVVRQLLPINEDIVVDIMRDIEDDVSDGDHYKVKGSTSYIFEPDEESVLAYVLEKLVEVLVYQALIESQASEHSARRAAMKNATDNAQSVYDDLKLGFNRARQAAITREISEISAGAEAVK